MLKKVSLVQSVFALGLCVLSSCSLTPEPAAPRTGPQSANSEPCYDCPPGGGGGGGGGYQPTCIPTTTTAASRVRREATLYAYGKGWRNIRVTVGIEGCDAVYPFSIDFEKQLETGGWVATWTQGTYDIANGAISVPEYDEPPL